MRSDLQAELRQPIQGWFGAADQFAMRPGYEPAPGIDRFLVGTPPVLSLVGVEEGARVLAAAGIDRLRAKGQAMTSYLVTLSDAWLAPLGFRLASPRDPALRGSHVSLEHPRPGRSARPCSTAGWCRTTGRRTGCGSGRPR